MRAFQWILATWEIGAVAIKDKIQTQEVEADRFTIIRGKATEVATGREEVSKILIIKIVTLIKIKILCKIILAGRVVSQGIVSVFARS